MTDSLKIIKDCPCCGSEGTLWEADKEYWIRCSNNDCGIEQFSMYETKEDAIRRWNKRSNKGNKDE